MSISYPKEILDKNKNKAFEAHSLQKP